MDQIKMVFENIINTCNGHFQICDLCPFEGHYCIFNNDPSKWDLDKIMKAICKMEEKNGTSEA